MVLSPLADCYLRSLERRDFIRDLAVVSQLLAKLNVPITRPLLDFHETFGGYVGKNWMNDVEFGLVLSDDGWGTTVQNRDGTVLIQCAEVDPQDWPPYLDLEGRYYRSTNDEDPIASNFFFHIEQCAFALDWARRTGAASIPFPWAKAKLFRQTIRGLMTGCELSGYGDDYSDLYLKDNLLVYDSSYSTGLWIAPGPCPQELIEFIDEQYQNR